MDTRDFYSKQLDRKKQDLKIIDQFISILEEIKIKARAHSTAFLGLLQTCITDMYQHRVERMVNQYNKSDCLKDIINMIYALYSKESPENQPKFFPEPVYATQLISNMLSLPQYEALLNFFIANGFEGDSVNQMGQYYSLIDYVSKYSVCEEYDLNNSI